eukprot:353961-Chlamydomonas_euryale.AAC.4
MGACYGRCREASGPGSHAPSARPRDAIATIPATAGFEQGTCVGAFPRPPRRGGEGRGGERAA